VRWSSTATTRPVRQRPAVADAIQSLGDNVIVGDPGVVAMVGSVAWIVAVVAAAIAYRQIGASVLATILLALSFMVVSHPPPVGPIGLVCFASAVALLARAQHHSSRLEAAAPAPLPTKPTALNGLPLARNGAVPGSHRSACIDEDRKPAYVRSEPRAFCGPRRMTTVRSSGIRPQICLFLDQALRPAAASPQTVLANSDAQVGPA
jgi:hypothetical protein